MNGLRNVSKTNHLVYELHYMKPTNNKEFELLSSQCEKKTNCYFMKLALLITCSPNLRVNVKLSSLLILWEAKFHFASLQTLHVAPTALCQFLFEYPSLLIPSPHILHCLVKGIVLPLVFAMMWASNATLFLSSK
jgi:hypothetical protein